MKGSIMDQIRPALESEFRSCCLLFGENATSYFIEYVAGIRLLLSDKLKMEVNRAAHDIIIEGLESFHPYTKGENTNG